MKSLDKNERTLLADSFLLLAQAVGTFRIENYSKLTPKMKFRIREYHKCLIDYADTFYASSTSFIVKDTSTSIASIRKIAADMESYLHRVKNIQKIINTIGAATRLGASIVSKQPFAITSSLTELISSFEKLKSKTNKKN